MTSVNHAQRVIAKVNEDPRLAEALDAMLKDPLAVAALLETYPEKALEAGKDELPAAPKVYGKQAFIKKYGIQILADSQVVVTLPEGMSRVEFLRKALAISQELYKRNAVYNERLATWENDSSFNGKLTETLTIAADARIANSNRLARSEMENKGWLDLDIQDLAVAHAAYFIATGKDVFQGDIVRARVGALRFTGIGLDVRYYNDGDRDSRVSASRSLPVPN